MKDSDSLADGSIPSFPAMKNDQSQIIPEDRVKAQAEWELANPSKSWDDLRTQSKNRLAMQQFFHRGYHDLCNAILRRN